MQEKSTPQSSISQSGISESSVPRSGELRSGVPQSSDLRSNNVQPGKLQPGKLQPGDLLLREYWQRAVAFHGHECPGLAIGFKAVEGVIAEFDLDASQLPAIDEELVCITENDACCVDAIQSLLGCTFGKANLIPRLRGKMAFSFYVRDANGLQGAIKAVRLYLKPDLGEGMSRDEFQEYLLTTPYTDLFEIKAPNWDLPEPARHFDSHLCSVCGESTAEYALRFHEGKPVCVDCYDAYDREGF